MWKYSGMSVPSRSRPVAAIECARTANRASSTPTFTGALPRRQNDITTVRTRIAAIAMRTLSAAGRTRTRKVYWTTALAHMDHSVPKTGHSTGARHRGTRATVSDTNCDIVIVGAGAAGLATAIFARRHNRTRSVVLLDGAKKPGAKILVSGGSRCNVTNVVVTERDFWGGRSAIVRRILRALPAAETVAFFREIGVALHEEANGKLFPNSNRPLDASRHILRARIEHRAVTVTMSLRPGDTFEMVDADLTARAIAQPRSTLQSALAAMMPASVAAATLRLNNTDGATALAHLSRDDRRRVARAIVESPLAVLDSRGYNFAEATAGGVALTEIDPATMGSRLHPVLFLVGEMLDVDGRIGGFNFQWAWSSGFVAGRALGANAAAGDQSRSSR